MTRVNDANAIFRQKPYLSVRGFRYSRMAVGPRDIAPDPVRVVENRGGHGPFRISDPPFQIVPGHAYQATRHIQPEEMVIVLQHPLNAVAWQTIRTGKLKGTVV